MEDNGIGSAVEQLIGLAKANKRTEILPAAPEPSGSYYLVGPDGTAQLKTAQPSRHGETIDTPLDLGRFIKDRPDAGGVIYLGQEKIVYVYSREDRRDVAVCPLKISPQYQWLSSPPSQMTQVDFVRTLRIVFRGCLMSENLLPLMRQIKFNNGVAGDSSIQQGRESMGRQITAQVTGTDAIPEETGMNIQVFENHSFKVKVSVAIEVFPQEATFKMLPFPLELKSAMDATMDDLAVGFTVEGMPPVYRGKP